MDPFHRLIGILALLQELVIFMGLIVTLAMMNSHEKFGIVVHAPTSRILAGWWGLLVLIPVTWAVLVLRDGAAENPRCSERTHLWIGVGLLVLWTLFAASASMGAMSPPVDIRSTW